MSVRILAIALLIAGVLLPVLGWQTDSPIGFVGPALLLLGSLLLWTRKHRDR